MLITTRTDRLLRYVGSASNCYLFFFFPTRENVRRGRPRTWFENPSIFTRVNAAAEKKKPLCTVIIKPGVLFSIYGNRVNSFHFFLCDFQTKLTGEIESSTDVPRISHRRRSRHSRRRRLRGPSRTDKPIDLFAGGRRTRDNTLTWYIFRERSVS